jgi:hypothetical protein
MLTFASQDDKSCWMWKKPPPASKKRVADSVGPEDGKVIRIIKRQKTNISVREKLLKGMVFNQFNLKPSMSTLLNICSFYGMHFDHGHD